ncbi:MAG TPA: hypothetical protein DCS87_15160 [Rheinheimera sp.]|nr:hypothetical protein [Rheinheimera sp.]
MTKPQFHANQVQPTMTASAVPAASTKAMPNTAWQRLVHQATTRLQQPGDHWFFVLYLGGLAALLLLVSLLKLGIAWL